MIGRTFTRTGERHMRRPIIVFASALAVSLSPFLAGMAQGQSPAAATVEVTKRPYGDVIRLLDTWLEAELAYSRVRGFSAAVVVGPELVWSKGYGTIDIGRKVLAAPNTIYSVCSISKLFTSIAVMQLWEAGKLSLDDDVARYLPGFAIRRSDPDSGPITIRSLLTHSSGLPRESEFPYWTGPDFKFPTRQEMLRMLADQATLMRASDRYQYSNLAMSLLGEVVVSVAGVPYDTYVKNNILAPLGLSDTRTVMPMELYGRQLAQGFGAVKRDGSRDLLKPFDAAGITAAAGYTSTVQDLAKFASWQFRLLKNGGTELLRVSTLREMQRVQWADPDGKNTRGLGFWVRKDGATTLVGHSGSCPGYLSGLALVPKDELAIIAMTNGNGGDDEIAHFTKPMRQLMAKGLKLTPAPIGPGSPDLEAYVGKYDFQPWASEGAVVPWGSRLAVIDLPNPDPAGSLLLLQHVAGDTFRALRDDDSLAETWVFERGPDGRVVRLRTNGQSQNRLAP